MSATSIVRLVCAGLALALCCCSRPEAEARKREILPSRDVTLVAAAATPLPDTVLAYGSLAADEEVDLAFRHAGPLGRLEVDLGSDVQEGQLVAALDTTNLALQVREVEAAVRQARVRLGLPADGGDDEVDAEDTAAVRQARAVLREATLTRDRAQDLVQRELAAPASLDAALAAFGVAESRLQQALTDVQEQQAALAQRRIELAIAEQALKESALVAPFAGVVSERRKTVPEFVAVGEAVVTVLRVDPLRLRLRVPEREASGVTIGQVVRFTVDGAPGTFEGTVARLAPAIDPANRTLLVEVRVPNAARRLRSGLFARATIEVSAPQPSVTVPASAVVTFAGIEKVFVVDGGVAREQRIETGRRLGDRVEVDDGLAIGTPVVDAPGDLVDGQPVRVTEGSR